MKPLRFSLVALLFVALAACSHDYRYMPKATGEAPASVTPYAALKNERKVSIIEVLVATVNGASAKLGKKPIALSPGPVKIEVVVKNALRHNVKDARVEFAFTAKAKEKYNFVVTGDEWNYTVMLKDSKGKVVLQKEFVKAAVVRRSILDL